MTDKPRVLVAMAASSFVNTAYLIAAPTRTSVQRAIGEVSLVGMPLGSAGGAEDELEKILWVMAAAAAGSLEGHLARLQAIVEWRKAAEVGFRR